MAKQLKVIDDIHYSPARGLITRNEAIVDCIAVELMPYLKAGTYTYIPTIDGDIVLVSRIEIVDIEDEYGDERELNGEYGWMEFE